MRWMKHFTDARHNPKFRAIEKKFGEAGYARAFKLFEIVAGRGGKAGDFSSTIDLRKPPTDLDWLAEELKIPVDDVTETLDFFAAVRLIDQKAWRKKIVEVPQMLEYLDEWTQRQQRAKNSEGTPEQLPSYSGKSRSRVEGEKEADREKNTAAAAASLKGNCKKIFQKAWDSLGIEPLGSIQFREAWEDFYAPADGQSLDVIMERCIQYCQGSGIKVPPPFFDAKRRIEQREADEGPDEISRMEKGTRGVREEMMR